ncbi:MAG: hypothetical protein ACK4UO_05355 [Pseudolabrys sp.]
MFGHSGMEAGLIGTALTVALMEALVERGVLTKDDANTIIISARDELRAHGNTVAIHKAVETIDSWMLPRVKGGKA